MGNQIPHALWPKKPKLKQKHELLHKFRWDLKYPYPKRIQKWKLALTGENMLSERPECMLQDWLPTLRQDGKAMCVDAPEDTLRWHPDLSQFCKKHQPCEWIYFQILPQAWKVHFQHTRPSRVSWILPAEAFFPRSESETAFLFLSCALVHIPWQRIQEGFSLHYCMLRVVDETVIGNWNHMSKRE